jgi:DNA-binding MarR family transcriptional regulator
MSQQAPADVIMVDHPNLIATLDELPADGLIRREIDPDDRRGRTLQVRHQACACSARASPRTSEPTMRFSTA